MRKDGRRIRLFTRRGFDWSDRYPAITIALQLLRVRSATIDGEAICCGKDGISDFDKLHSHAHSDDVFLYAFDLLELNGVPRGLSRHGQSAERRTSSKSKQFVAQVLLACGA